MLGYAFNETMRGTVQPNGSDLKQLLFFDITATATSIWRFLRDQLTAIEGTVTVGGLATKQPITGTIEIAPLTKKKLIYLFDFQSDEGKSCRFEGEKYVKFTQPLKSMTTLYGTVFVERQPYAKGTILFDLKDLPQFLMSYRFV